MVLPLPPLSEQQRIVARIEEVAAKIEEAHRLRRQSEGSAQALLRSTLFSGGVDLLSRAPMHDLVRLREPDVDVSPEATYEFAGVYCFGRGIFRERKKRGIDFAYKSLTRIRAGDFVYPKLMAWEGALAVVPPEFKGLVVSPEFPVFEVNQEKALPETLDVYFRTPSVWSELGEISTGTNVRRRRLHPNAFLAYEMSLPPMSIQLRLRKINESVWRVKQLQAETAAELDALLPSILDKAFKGDL
jgi:type I restriction enzyme S subunit